jgi:hypothetical protein
MPLRFPSVLVAFRTLTAAALVYSIFWWSVLAPGAAFDGSECFAALGLVWCAVVLSLFGHATAALASRYCTQSATGSGLEEKSPLSRLPYISKAIIALAIGQVVAMGWVFARSALSGIAYAVTGRQLPITTLEVLALLVGAGFVVLRRRPNALSRHSAFGAVSFIGVLVCIVAPLAFRDLPRSVALSSDPDQHAFWASQVFKLGIVPWDQGLTGVGPFGYPAGFAVLNAVWMVFSGLTAVEIVTIQPMLQFLLAVVLCVAVGPLLVGRNAISRRIDDVSITLASLLCVLTYWYVLPYGLQGERFHGEGTARLSCSLLSALPILLWIARLSVPLTHTASSAQPFAACVSVALLATINPLSAFLPGIFAGLITLAYLVRGVIARQARLVSYALLASALAAVLIIGGEPYFVTRIVSALSPSGDATTAPISQASTSLPFSFALSAAQVRESLQPSRLVEYLLAGTYADKASIQPAHWTLGVSFVLWIASAPWVATRGAIALVVCGAVAFAFTGLQAIGSVELPLYLIQPYVVQSVLQCGAVLGFLLLTPLSILLFSARGVVHTLFVSLLCVYCFCFAAAPMTQRTGAFNMNVRGGYCGTMACLSDSDLAALTFLEGLGERITLKYPGLSYDEAPKVLILGIPASLGNENWVFPSGSARVVPLFSKLPVAFFYGRGHQDWTFENYQERLCKSLDLDWLKKRNVRYIFLAKKDPGCFKRRREIVRQSKVLFDAGGARVLQLF